MPPRSRAVPAATVVVVPDGYEEDPTAPNDAGTQSITSEYGDQESRTIRSHHSLPTSNISRTGSTPVYLFHEVLNFAYSQGFLGFGEPAVQIHPGLGHKGGPLAVVVATGWFKSQDGDVHQVWGTGDASPENCGNLTGPAFVRMAETRAQGRLLNRALNLHAVMAEELFEEEVVPTKSAGAPASAPRPLQRPSPPSSNGLTPYAKSNLPEYWPEPNGPDGTYVCTIDGCDNEVKGGKSAFWAKQKTGQIVCWDHQQELAAKKA